MHAYLMEERGVPVDAIIEEDRSTTTMENLRNSKAIMDARSGAGQYRAAVVTSDYHVFRTAEYAHKIGLAADGVGSKTARYFWPTAFIREFVAVSNAHRWPFVVIFAAACGGLGGRLGRLRAGAARWPRRGARARR